ncbi:MAG: hypothetical protein GXO92_05415 [FCB group bacterium]|nr:hypothetical protein [FCB group bacterium]
MWFVPVLNPDGYVYNERYWNTYNRPGYHRKNRRDTGCGSGTERGIDLNRNYGFAWGANNMGSSSYSCSETFRGDSAFSEPETDALRRFVSAHDFKNILHYHSYSNVLIHSYGDGSYPEEPDLTTLREIGAEMTRENGYPVGTGVDLIGYPVNGDAVDWTFGTMGLLSYTPEVGSFQDNFWPSEDRVLPLCKKQYYQNKVFSFVAGSDPFLYDYQLPARIPAPADTVSFTLIIQNRGLSPTNGPVSVSIAPLDSLLRVFTARDTLPGLPARTTGTLEVALSVSPRAPAWTRSGFLVEVRDSLSFPRSDTVRFLIGETDYLYGDLVADGELDIYDILKLADIILRFTEMSEVQAVVADIVPDGTIDINDLLALVDIVMGR